MIDINEHYYFHLAPNYPQTIKNILSKGLIPAVSACEYSDPKGEYVYLASSVAEAQQLVSCMRWNNGFPDALKNIPRQGKYISRGDQLRILKKYNPEFIEQFAVFSVYMKDIESDLITRLAQNADGQGWTREYLCKDPIEPDRLCYIGTLDLTGILKDPSTCRMHLVFPNGAVVHMDDFMKKFRNDGFMECMKSYMAAI